MNASDFLAQPVVATTKSGQPIRLAPIMTSRTLFTSNNQVIQLTLESRQDHRPNGRMITVPTLVASTSMLIGNALLEFRAELETHGVDPTEVLMWSSESDDPATVEREDLAFADNVCDQIVKVAAQQGDALVGAALAGHEVVDANAPVEAVAQKMGCGNGCANCTGEGHCH